MNAPHNIRLVSWNVDGLTRLLPTPSASNANVAEHERPPLSLQQVVQALCEPDVLCLQEIRIRPQDDTLVAAMRDALPEYECGYSLCADAKNARFRGGRTYGVTTYVRKALAPVWLPRASWDREGRLVCVALPSQRLFIANVYAVNGTDKPYFDHDAGAYRGDRHLFKRAFQQQLREYFAAARAQGMELVLIGDWNVSRSARDVTPRLRTEAPHVAARAMLNDEFIPSLDVVDAFRELHPEAASYTWFQRSSRRQLDAARVDYALLSRTLLPRLTEATIAEDARFHSDHAPISVSLAF